MAELYGPAFAAAYGDKASPLWLGAISGLTDEECSAGLRRLASEGKEYPANLTQFVAACRPKSAGVRYLGRPISDDERRALLPAPEHRASSHEIDGWLAKIRRTLGVKAE